MQINAKRSLILINLLLSSLAYIVITPLTAASPAFYQSYSSFTDATTDVVFLDGLLIAGSSDGSAIAFYSNSTVLSIYYAPSGYPRSLATSDTNLWAACSSGIVYQWALDFMNTTVQTQYDTTMPAYSVNYSPLFSKFLFSASVFQAHQWATNGSLISVVSEYSYTPLAMIISPSGILYFGGTSGHYLQSYWIDNSTSGPVLQPGNGDYHWINQLTIVGDIMAVGMQCNENIFGASYFVTLNNASWFTIKRWTGGTKGGALSADALFYFTGSGERGYQVFSVYNFSLVADTVRIPELDRDMWRIWCHGDGYVYFSGANAVIQYSDPLALPSDGSLTSTTPTTAVTYKTTNELYLSTDLPTSLTKSSRWTTTEDASTTSTKLDYSTDLPTSTSESSSWTTTEDTSTTSPELDLSTELPTRTLESSSWTTTQDTSTTSTELDYSTELPTSTSESSSWTTTEDVLTATATSSPIGSSGLLYQLFLGSTMSYSFQYQVADFISLFDGRTPPSWIGYTPTFGQWTPDLSVPFNSAFNVIQFGLSLDQSTSVFAIQFNGYILPSVSGSYHFYSYIDNYMYMWIGSPAENPGMSNTADNVFWSRMSSIVSCDACSWQKSTTITLTAGVLYPILVYYANGVPGDSGSSAGPSGLEIGWMIPGASDYTADGFNFLYPPRLKHPNITSAEALTFYTTDSSSTATVDELSTSTETLNWDSTETTTNSQNFVMSTSTFDESAAEATASSRLVISSTDIYTANAEQTETLFIETMTRDITSAVPTWTSGTSIESTTTSTSDTVPNSKDVSTTTESDATMTWEPTSSTPGFDKPNESSFIADNLSSTDMMREYRSSKSSQMTRSSTTDIYFSSTDVMTTDVTSLTTSTSSSTSSSSLITSSTKSTHATSSTTSSSSSTSSTTTADTTSTTTTSATTLTSLASSSTSTSSLTSSYSASTTKSSSTSTSSTSSATSFSSLRANPSTSSTSRLARYSTFTVTSTSTCSTLSTSTTIRNSTSTTSTASTYTSSATSRTSFSTITTSYSTSSNSTTLTTTTTILSNPDEQRTSAPIVPIIAGLVGGLLGLGTAALLFARKRKRDQAGVRTIPDDTPTSKENNLFIDNVMESPLRPATSPMAPLPQIPSAEGRGLGVVDASPVQRAGGLEPIVSSSAFALLPISGVNISAIPSASVKPKLRVRAKKLAVSPTSGDDGGNDTDQSQAKLRQVLSINASPDKQSSVSPTGGVLSSEDLPSPDRLPEIGSVAAAKKKRVRTKKPYITEPESDSDKKAVEAALRELQSVQAKLAEKEAQDKRGKGVTPKQNTELTSGQLQDEGMVGYGDLFQHRNFGLSNQNTTRIVTSDLEAQDVEGDDDST